MKQDIMLFPSLNLNVQEGIDTYLQKIAHLPILSADEERALAQRWHQDNDIQAAKKLVLSQLRFVVHIARGYLGYGLAFADLIQEGNVGLMKAVKRFNPEQGVRLISFAVHWIKAEMHEFIVRNWRIVKIATTKAQRKLFFNLRQCKKAQHLSSQEAQIIAEELKVPLSDVHEMNLRLSANDVPFESPTFDQDDENSHLSTPMYYLEDHQSNPLELLTEQQEANNLDTLKQAVQHLNPREQMIIMQRWLVDDDQKATLQDLGTQLGISLERVRQIEKSALQKLKTALISPV